MVPAAPERDVTPQLSVVIASHDRPLRLRWLLNALEEQKLPRERWEVVVAHDSRGPETEALLRDHSLAQDGTLAAFQRVPTGNDPRGVRLFPSAHLRLGLCPSGRPCAMAGPRCTTSARSEQCPKEQ